MNKQFENEAQGLLERIDQLEREKEIYQQGMTEAEQERNEIQNQMTQVK